MLTSGHNERSAETRGSSYRYYLWWVLGFVAAPALVLAGILLPVASVGAPLLQATPTPASLVYLPHVTNQYAAITATPTVTPTATPITPPTGAPDPYFPYKDSRVQRRYDPWGNTIGTSVAQEVTNRGGAGQAFVRAIWVNKALTNTIVFPMDSGESVMGWAHFPVLSSVPFPFQDVFNWTTRPAVEGDGQAGDMEIVRSTLRRVGQYPEFVRDIALKGESAYVLQSGDLCILDLSDPSSVRQIGDCVTVGRAIPYSEWGYYSEYELALKDNYAYVAIGHLYQDGENGLHIVEMGDTKRVVGHYLTGESERPVGMAVVGNYAYLVTEKRYGGGNLLIIDVSDPPSPKEVGRYEHAGAGSMAIKDNYAYLGGAQNLYVVDVSSPNTPRQASKYYYGGGLSSGMVKDSIAASGNYAYLLTKACSLITFDVSTPSNPSEAGRWSPKDSCGGNDIAVVGGYAYLAIGGGGLSVVDIRDPSAPVEAGRYVGLRASGRRVAVTSDYVYLAGSDGLHVLK